MTSALTRYATQGHKAVEGWLLPVAVDMLVAVALAQQQAHVTGPVCEIGVHHGRLFILLSLTTTAGELSVAYDLFERQDENVDGSGQGSRARFVENVRRHGCDESRVKAIAVNSTELDAARVVADCGSRPRLFSIDGGHTAGITLNDIEIAARALCEGGVIILDDFFNEAWPGVAEGTCRYMFEHPGVLVPFAIGGNKVLLTTSARWASIYRNALSPLARTRSIKRSVIFESEVIVVTEEQLRFSERLSNALSPRHWRRWLRRTTAGEAAAYAWRRWLR